MYPKIQILGSMSGLHWDLHQDGVWLGFLTLVFTGIVVWLYICSSGGKEKEPT